MSPQARMAAGSAPVPEAGVDTSSDAGAGPFVINLTSSTTPMALSTPDSPELKRFSFFVSRRREDNRERFRLHMGYFATLAEAEEWLNIIRDLYPGAWAGEAPGKKLRARAAAAELAKQLPAPPAAATQTTAPAVTATRPPTAAKPAFTPPPARLAAAASATVPGVQPAVAALGAALPAAAAMGGMPSAPVSIDVPTLQAAPTLAPAPQAAITPSAAPMLEAVAQAAAALAAVAKMAQSSPGAFGAPDQTVMAPNPFAAAPAKQAAVSQPSFTPAPPPPVVATPPAPQAQRPAARGAGAAQSAGAAGSGAASSVGGAPSSSANSAGGAAQSAAPKAAAQSPKPAVAASAAAPARPAAKGPAPSKGAKKNLGNALTDGSNVREVMAALDETGETGETRQMQIPPGVRGAASAAKPATPVARPAASAAAPAAGSAARPSAPSAAAGRSSAPPSQNPNAAAAAKSRAPQPPARAAVADSGDSMSDTQVLRMLETRRSDEGEKGSDDANSGISLLKPDDTQTRRALKEAVIDNAPVSFAVQLQWSVQPVELDKVPPLAIFSAYTLYTVEGSREGRKWYGLRLGFFSDAISAKQVAYYVRSEFASVAVVPVSPAEKARASDEETKAATGAFQRKRVEQKIEEFKLFDDDDKSVVNEPPKAAAPKPAAPPKGPVRKNKPLGRVKAREQRSPKTLEETLEILGASDLEIDNGRGEVLNDTGVRHLRVEVQKNTPFAKLLDRISERVRKN